MMGQPVLADIMNLNEFKRIPPQFIAALGDPDAGSGNNAHSWGLWRLDPGPRGVWLDNFEQLKAFTSHNEKHTKIAHNLYTMPQITAYCI